MKTTLDKQNPVKKKQVPGKRKSETQNNPKKKIKKEAMLNNVEASLAAAIADLIIQQNLS